MTSIAVSLIIVGLLNTIFGLVVYRRAAMDIANRVFLILCVSIAFWTWGVAMFVMTENIFWAQAFVTFLYASAMYIGSSMLAFVLAVMNSRSRWLIASCFIPSIVYTFISIFWPGIVITVIGTEGSLTSRVIVQAIPHYIYAGFFIAMMTTALFLQFRLIKTSVGIVKHRQKIVVIYMTIASVFGSIFNLILPAFNYYDALVYGPMGSLVFILGMSYAIMKYSYFDLQQAFSRSIGYIATLLIIALMYLAGVQMIGATFASAGSFNVGFMYFLLVVIGGLSISSMHQFFDKMTEKIFFRKVYNADETIEKFGDAIAYSTNVRQTISYGHHTLRSTLHPAFVVTILVGPGPDSERTIEVTSHPHRDHEAFRKFEHLLHKTLSGRVQTVLNADLSQDLSKEIYNEMSRLGIGVVSKMRGHNQTIGYVIVGHKLNGETFSSTDIHLISTISDELALAIQNALRFTEIESFNHRLRDEIDSATSELRKSNLQLRKLDAIKDEFVGIASHQLRTPLTSVKGYLSMVLEGDVGKITADQRKLLTEAFESSERMVRLITDFLNVSRIQTGKFILDISCVDLAKVVEQEAESMRKMADSRDQKIKVTKSPRIPLLYIDDGKLRQVIMNFIDNAVFYSHDGGDIKVRLNVEEGHVCFSVEDSGIGVPKAEAEQLFSKFYRAGNARKKRPDGTGVGLYLAKRIVDEHGGSLIFSSKENVGSTFGFRLPIKKLSNPPSSE